MDFILEPCNFTLNIFQDFFLYIFNKNGDVYATINFLNFSRGETIHKINTECFGKTFLTNM